jgi:hypothetical protein
MVVRKACLWGESLFFADQQKETDGAAASASGFLIRQILTLTYATSKSASHASANSQQFLIQPRNAKSTFSRFLSSQMDRTNQLFVAATTTVGPACDVDGPPSEKYYKPLPFGSSRRSVRHILALPCLSRCMYSSWVHSTDKGYVRIFCGTITIE